MRPELWRFALWGAIGCALGGLLAEFALKPQAAPVGPPQSIALVLDTSGSMLDGNKMGEVVRASRDFVGRQNLSTVGISVVAFDTTGQTISALSHDSSVVLNALSSLEAGGATNLAQGLEKGLDTLRTEGGTQRKSLLVFTDGVPADENGDEAAARTQALEVASRVRAAGVQILAIGTQDADTDYLAQVTGNKNRVFSTRSGNFSSAFGQAERSLFGASSSGSSLLDALARSALVALFLGIFLLIALNVLTLRGQWFRDLGWVPFGAAALGALGGGLGQLIYASGGSRELGWALLGAGAGLFLGLADRSRTLALRGAAGGAVGGLVGGWFFQSFASVSAGGPFARELGFAVLGAAIGLMVMLAQQVFKSAWLYGVGPGPYEGKEYILAKSVVTVGRSDGNDIGLYREKALALKAGSLEQSAGKWRWKGEPLEVNGVLQKEAELKPGDRLRLGGTVFQFQMRGTGTPQSGSSTPALPTQNPRLEGWMLHDNARAYPLTGREVYLNLDSSALDLKARPSEALLSLSGAADGLKLEALSTGVQVNGQAVGPRSSVTLKAGDLLLLEGREVAVLRG